MIFTTSTIHKVPVVVQEMTNEQSCLIAQKEISRLVDYRAFCIKK
jgi:hypothetical protein